MKCWFFKIIQNKYRCWDDFYTYGFVSAGHDNPESDSLRRVNKGDKIFPYFSNTGILGVGYVKEIAVLAKNCVFDGDFIAKDFTGASSKAHIKDIMLRCPHLVDDMEDPRKGEWIIQVKWDHIANKPKNIGNIIDLKMLIKTVEEISNDEMISTIEKGFRDITPPFNAR